MSSSTISAIVIAVEFVLRAVCVYAILRVTLTLFSIRKAEKLEKERDAALAWLKYSCDDCEAWNAVKGERLKSYGRRAEIIDISQMTDGGARNCRRAARGKRKIGGAM